MTGVEDRPFDAALIDAALFDAALFDAVLFDFGGTLFDHTTGPSLVIEAAHSIGVDLAPELAESVWSEIDTAAMDPDEVALGRDLDPSIWQTRWAALYGLADRAAPGLGHAIDSSMLDPLAWVPYADTVAALEALHQAGVPVGVVSNTGWDVRQPFAVRGLERFVSSFVLSYEVGVAKPDPQIYRLGCDAVGTDPTRTLFVGDNPVTDGGAVTSGLGALLVPPVALGAAHGLLGAARLAGAI
jgi:HAD superfamily hydrolase (TIGR01493 family)